MRSYPLYIDGVFESRKQRQLIEFPFNQEVVAEMSLASSEDLEKALQAIARDRVAISQLSRWARSSLLFRISEKISENRKAFSNCIVEEAGKPLALAEAEVTRAIGTFYTAAEEAKRMRGELIPIDLDAAGRNFDPVLSEWRARGPVLAITPFNFPLNLVAHKVAPAIAVGAAVLLKPPPQAPGASVLLTQIFDEVSEEVSQETGEEIPKSFFQLVQAEPSVIAAAVSDERISILSFTGSDKVGWMLRDQAKKKKVLLELGGNASVIVEPDANLDLAAERIAFGAFAYAGQICISVQRVFAHEKIRAELELRLLAATEKMNLGDPREAKVIVSPLIDAANADRVEAWIRSAEKSGAKLLRSLKRERNLIHPVWLTNVKDSQKISCEEVFGPVAILESYSSLSGAIEKVNRSKYGLQAGLFTQNISAQQMAWRDLEVGGLLINEIPTYRADAAPYGGLKDSGMGREGVRFAMQEFCEMRSQIRRVDFIQ